MHVKPLFSHVQWGKLTCWNEFNYECSLWNQNTSTSKSLSASTSRQICALGSIRQVKLLTTCVPSFSRPAATCWFKSYDEGSRTDLDRRSKTLVGPFSGLLSRNKSSNKRKPRQSQSSVKFKFLLETKPPRCSKVRLRRRQLQWLCNHQDAVKTNETFSETMLPDATSQSFRLGLCLPCPKADVLFNL